MYNMNWYVGSSVGKLMVLNSLLKNFIVLKDLRKKIKLNL